MAKLGMAATVLQRSIQNSKIFDKSQFIEMDNAPSKDKAFETNNPQPKHSSNNPTETPPFQGSIASLESRFADQSEVQPLTRAHICRYDECHKFCQNKPPKEELESPVSPLKTAFLFLVVILLILWIIIYTILTQMRLL